MASESESRQVQIVYSLTGALGKKRLGLLFSTIFDCWIQFENLLYFCTAAIANIRTSIPLNADDIISLLQISKSLKRQAIPVKKIV